MTVMFFHIKNDYRLFTAYSDTEAKELGTIYQACSFYYLGKKFGTGYQYQLDGGRWVSDRYFRSRSVYKRLAISDGIDWDMNWQSGDRVIFDRMPIEVANRIKFLSKEYQSGSPCRKLQPKHKYAYVRGRDRRETRQLRQLFESRNRTYPYAKTRGE